MDLQRRQIYSVLYKKFFTNSQSRVNDRFALQGTKIHTWCSVALLSTTHPVAYRVRFLGL